MRVQTISLLEINVFCISACIWRIHPGKLYSKLRFELEVLCETSKWQYFIAQKKKKKTPIRNKKVHYSVSFFMPAQHQANN